MNRSVRELTTAIASGDTEAFAVFFRSRFDDLSNYARRWTGRDESFCMDVVQDAMLRVIRSLPPMDDEDRLQAWLRSAVQACAYDRLRKDSRRQRRELAAGDSRPSGDAGAETEERLRWLRREILASDDPNTAMLVLRYRLGWTLQRIGTALGLTPGAVDGRIGRLVGHIRRRARETIDD